MRTASAEVFAPPVGGTVRVRPIPSKLIEVFARKARLPDGKVDINEFHAQKLAYGMVDPSFTVEEIHQILRQWGPAINLVLDAIDGFRTSSHPLRRALVPSR